MAGAPSQVDLKYYKPELHKLLRPSYPSHQQVAVIVMTRGRQQLVAPSTFKFSQQGKSGV